MDPRNTGPTQSAPALPKSAPKSAAGPAAVPPKNAPKSAAGSAPALPKTAPKSAAGSASGKPGAISAATPAPSTQPSGGALPTGLLSAFRGVGTSALNPYESKTEMPLQGRIDELVFGKLSKRGILPAKTCSDEVFLRRAYLDVIGTMPTPEEARKFYTNLKPSRRRDLVDDLLDREEFADYWSMKWSDILRVKAEFPINLWPNAVQAYHHCIRQCLHDNVPYNTVVREWLTSSGSNFRVPAVNFYRGVQSRTPEGIAAAVALTLMGERISKWSPKRVQGMAAFFSTVEYKQSMEWKEEIVMCDPQKRVTGAVFPDGTPTAVPAGRDPRDVFADWLLAPSNPCLARNLVNRVWSWLLGRGIIQEPDDIRPDNPPSNPELLTWLHGQFIASGYNLKHLYKMILHSKTYQLSSIPRSRNPDGEKLFAHYDMRRVEAEVLIDALDQISGTTESYSSAAPEPFTWIPETERSIVLADGSITSPFLEMFGRPSRDTGLDSERNNRPTAEQRLHLLNSSHIQRKLDKVPALLANYQAPGSRPDPTELAYLLILSRYPTEEERKIVAGYKPDGQVNPRATTLDLVWALVNSAEFLYRH